MIVSGYAWFGHSRYSQIKSEYAEFVARAEARAAEQKADNAIKEKSHAEKIHAAERSRNAALVKLRDQARTRGSVLPDVAAGAAGTETICFDRRGLDVALRNFTTGVEGLVLEGDQAIIDNRSWLSSWPE